MSTAITGSANYTTVIVIPDDDEPATMQSGSVPLDGIFEDLIDNDVYNFDYATSISSSLSSTIAQNSGSIADRVTDVETYVSFSAGGPIQYYVGERVDVNTDASTPTRSTTPDKLDADIFIQPAGLVTGSQQTWFLADGPAWPCTLEVLNLDPNNNVLVRHVASSLQESVTGSLNGNYAKFVWDGSEWSALFFAHRPL